MGNLTHGASASPLDTLRVLNKRAAVLTHTGRKQTTGSWLPNAEREETLVDPPKP